MNCDFCYQRFDYFDYFEYSNLLDSQTLLLFNLNGIAFKFHALWPANNSRFSLEYWSFTDEVIFKILYGSIFLIGVNISIGDNNEFFCSCNHALSVVKFWLNLSNIKRLFLQNYRIQYAMIFFAIHNKQEQKQTLKIYPFRFEFCVIFLFYFRTIHIRMCVCGKYWIFDQLAKSIIESDIIFAIPTHKADFLFNRLSSFLCFFFLVFSFLQYKQNISSAQNDL